MLPDVVVDTNVLGHAQNPNIGAYFVEATEFLERLVGTETPLCLDAPPRRRSRILSEYHRVVGVTGIAGAFLADALTSGRYVEVPARVSSAVRGCVCRLIPDSTKTMDRLLLCVAYNSGGSTLVTHDDADFPDGVRERAAAELRVAVLDAIDCTQRL